MMNPNAEEPRDPIANNGTMAARPAQAGGTLIPPAAQRSLQRTREAEKSRRARIRREQNLLTLKRKQAALVRLTAIPPAPDPLSP